MSDASGDDGCDELHIPVDWMTWLFSLSIAMGFSGLLIYLYFLRKGQFEDEEDVKYQMFREEKD